MTMSQRKYLQAILVTFSILLFLPVYCKHATFVSFPFVCFWCVVLGEEELHSNLVHQELTENQEVAAFSQVSSSLSEGLTTS